MINPDNPPSESPARAERFDAFISYSRRDSDFARALEKRLEKYRPPSSLGVGRRHLRVFRDEGDLTGTEYFSSIDEFISLSDKLVLICSPSSRGSEFVNDEVRRFVELRGPEHVIPILLDGVPDNEATEENLDRRAFPPALLEAMEMPLATPWLGWKQEPARVDRGRYQGSWYGLIANLLDRTREEVEERTLRRQRRVRAIAASSAIAIIVSLALLSVWALFERSAARTAQATAESRLLAAKALQPPRGDPLYSLVHALAGLLRAETFEADGALLQVVEEPRVLLRIVHDGDVLDAVPSGSGDAYLTVSRDGTARVSDTTSASMPRVLQGHTGPVLGGAWSPSGARVATGGDDGTVRTWDATAGTELSNVSLGDPVSSLAWGPGGIAALAGGDLTLLDGEGRVAVTVAGGSPPIVQLAVDPTGGWVATAAESDTVRVWDATSGAPLHALALPRPGWSVERIAASGDGRRLAVTDRGARVTVWDVATGERLLETRPSTGLVAASAVERMAESSGQPLSALDGLVAGYPPSRNIVALDSTGSRLAIGVASEGVAEVLDVESGELIARTGTHRGPLTDVRLDARGSWVLTASEDRTARLWRAEDGRELESYGGHHRSVGSAAFAPDGAWVVTSSIDHTARVWEVPIATRGTSLATAHGGALGGFPMDGRFAFSPDGRRVAMHTRDGIEVRGTGVGELLMSFAPEQGRTHLASILDADGSHLAVLWSDNRVDWFDVDADTLLSTLQMPGRAWRLRISPNDGAPLIAVVGDRTTWVFDAATGERRFDAPSVNLADSVPLAEAIRLDPAVFSPDGSVLAVMEGRAVALWDANAFERRATLLPDSGGARLHTVEFSQDGLRVLAAGRSAARVFDVADGRPVSPVLRDPSAILTASPSPSGTRVVAGLDDFSAVLWDVPTGQELHRLEGHTSEIRLADWDPDGEHLVTYAPGEEAVLLWDVATGNAQTRFTAPAGDSTVGVWYHRGDGRLVIGSRDAAVRVMRTDRCPLLVLAHGRLPLRFTRSDWEELLGEIEPPDWPPEGCALDD